MISGVGARTHLLSMVFLYGNTFVWFPLDCAPNASLIGKCRVAKAKARATARNKEEAEKKRGRKRGKSNKSNKKSNSAVAADEGGATARANG